jgi:hypothetical protein
MTNRPSGLRQSEAIFARNLFGGRKTLGRQTLLGSGWKNDLFPIQAERLPQSLGIRFDPAKGKTVGEPFPATTLDNPSKMVPNDITL